MISIISSSSSALERTSGLEASVIFVPWRDDIKTCYSLFDILVLSSQGEEGLPLCTIEALSLGKPVIASGNGGLRDLLENEFNALLVDEASPGTACQENVGNAGLIAKATTVQ